MKSKKGSAMLGKFLFYFGNTLIGIVFVSPLIWMISASFKPEAKIFANMNSLTTFLPVDPSFDNYIEVFRRINMANVFKNTLLYIALILVFDLVINSICGYALAKFEFRGRKLMLSFIVALMVLPMEAILLPLYIEMSQLGWVNTLRALVIPFIAKCFSIYMFYNFFHDIPDDLIEAAAIDGSSPVRTFFSINSHAPVYMSRYAFEPHYNGTEKYIGLDRSLAGSGRIIFVDEEKSVADGITLYGCHHAPRTADFGSCGLNMVQEGKMLEDDFRHEQYLLVEEKGKKILFSGCSHRGILNIMNWFHPDILIGGFHLSKFPMDETLARIAKELDSYPTAYYTGHCTGQKAWDIMHEELGDKVHALQTGLVFEL